MSAETEELEQLANQDYKYGVVTDIEQESAPPGLNEDIIGFISAKKEEPEWLLDWRLKAYNNWQKMVDPTHAKPSEQWVMADYPKIDYQDIIYYSAPKLKEGPKSLDEVDPELLETYEKLGIPLEEQKMLAGVAVDAVFDAMRMSMQRGERIELRGFGVFQVKPRKRGIGRNPRTGKEVRIPPGRTIRFKPGKDLQNIGG